MSLRSGRTLARTPPLSAPVNIPNAQVPDNIESEDELSVRGADVVAEESDSGHSGCPDRNHCHVHSGRSSAANNGAGSHAHAGGNAGSNHFTPFGRGHQNNGSFPNGEPSNLRRHNGGISNGGPDGLRRQNNGGIREDGPADHRRQEHITIPGLDRLTRALANLGNQPSPTHRNQNLSIMDMYGLVPPYDGKTSPENFIDCGDFVYQALGLTQVPVFLNLIRVRLTGRAHGACLRVNFSSWNACKRSLRQVCQTKCSSAELKAKLQAMSQGNESAREWGDKIERCLHDLNGTIQAEFQNPSREVYQALVQVHENMALGTFEDGLRLEELRVTVRAAARPTLGEAINLAAKQEVRIKRTYPSHSQNPPRPITAKIPDTKPARPEPTCFKCGVNGHYANTCTKPPPGASAGDLLANHPQNTNCNYCKQPGHQINQCKLREENNARRSSRDTNPFRSRPNDGDTEQRQGRRTYPIQDTRSPSVPNPEPFFSASTAEPLPTQDGPTMASGNYSARDAPMGQAFRM